MGAGESKAPGRRVHSNSTESSSEPAGSLCRHSASFRPLPDPPPGDSAPPPAASPPRLSAHALTLPGALRPLSDGERSSPVSNPHLSAGTGTMVYALPSFDGAPRQVSSPIPLYKNDLSVSPATPMLRSFRMQASPPLHARFMGITGNPAGLRNYGNTCYCNAVIQLLYHCTSLRLRILELHDMYVNEKGGEGFENHTILARFASLFSKMHKANNRKKNSKQEIVASEELLACVKKSNPTFDNALQHDAHEFAMFVLSNIIETETRMMADAKNRSLFFNIKNKKSTKSFGLSSLKKRVEEDREAAGSLSFKSGDGPESKAQRNGTTTAAAEADSTTPSPLQTIFGGQFASLWACLECEKIVMHSEAFMDLSLEIAQGCSLRRCLDNFSAPELFCGRNKLHCENCGKAVVAQKSIQLHRLPEYALLVHLKRFQYDEKKGGMAKKNVHVAIPREMDVEEYELRDAFDDCASNDLAEPLATIIQDECSDVPINGDANNSSVNSDKSNDIDEKDCPQPSERLTLRLKGLSRRKARFALSGFVTHVGEGSNTGHYFTCVRQGERWRKFDDHIVTEITEREVQENYGVPVEVSNVKTATAYILLYERVA